MSQCIKIKILLLVSSHFLSLELRNAAGQVQLGHRVPYRRGLRWGKKGAGLLLFVLLMCMQQLDSWLFLPCQNMGTGSMVGGDIYLFISLQLCGFMRHSYTWPDLSPLTHSHRAQRAPAKSFRSRLHTRTRMQTGSIGESNSSLQCVAAWSSWFVLIGDAQYKICVPRPISDDLNFCWYR